MIRRSPNGATQLSEPQLSRCIRHRGSKPGEVKHLSTQRKIKRSVLCTQHSLSSGERKGTSPNQVLKQLSAWGCKVGTFSLGRKALNPLSRGSGFCDGEERKVTNLCVSRTGWKA